MRNGADRLSPLTIMMAEACMGKIILACQIGDTLDLMR